MKTEPCFHCGVNAEYECDFVLGFEKKGTAEYRDEKTGKLTYPPYDYLDDTSDMFTCSRPICEACRTNVGSIFYEGEEAGSISIDYCKEHAIVGSGSV